MNKYVIGMVALATAAVLTAAVPAFAQTNTTGNTNRSASAHQFGGVGGPGRGQGAMRPSLLGTVSAVSGDTLSVLGRTGFGKTATATTTYTVDATNAKVMKGNATSTVAGIAVGDTVIVQGTVTGTNITATMIRDFITGGSGRGPGKVGTSTPAITGNGQPVIAGTISTISGSMLSITNKSEVTYSVDATNAKILQGNTVSDISTLKTGDTILVQGAVNGTSVVASSVIDQTRPAANSGNSKNNSNPGFFGGIGQFFMHLFGF